MVYKLLTTQKLKVYNTIFGIISKMGLLDRDSHSPTCTCINCIRKRKVKRTIIDDTGFVIKGESEENYDYEENQEFSELGNVFARKKVSARFLLTALPRLLMPVDNTSAGKIAYLLIEQLVIGILMAITIVLTIDYPVTMWTAIAGIIVLDVIVAFAIMHSDFFE